MIMITLVAIVCLITLDQLSKIWAVGALSQGNDILLWKNVFHLAYIENKGAAFGMLQGKQWFLIGMTIIVLIGMFFYLTKLPRTKVGNWSRFSFILIISGAIGNLIDRVLLNYVRDFLYFRLIDFPVFNLADIFVVVGVMILLVVIIFGEIEKPHQTKE